MVIGALAVFSLVQRPRGAPVIRAIENGTFYMEGDLAYWGEERTWQGPVSEYAFSLTHGIEYSDKTYLKVADEYYVADEAGNQTCLSDPSVPDALMFRIEEMFARASVLPSISPSEFSLLLRSEREVPVQESGEPVLCGYEEYQLDGTPHTLGLYFLGGDLYAIQSDRDPWWIFYVSTFSADPFDHIPPADEV